MNEPETLANLIIDNTIYKDGKYVTDKIVLRAVNKRIVFLNERDKRLYRSILKKEISW